MKIWKLKTDANNFDFFIIPTQKDIKRLNEFKFDGSSLASIWEPLNVEIEEAESRRSDTPTFNYGLVFSIKAVDVLHDLIVGCSEILPIKFRKEMYYLINVTKVIDCIDYSQALYIPFESTRRPMIFTKYAFKYDLIKTEHIFKTVEHPKAYVFVSDQFRKKVINSGLVGFRFEEVWELH